jgi:hypothetical protein
MRMATTVVGTELRSASICPYANSTAAPIVNSIDAPLSAISALEWPTSAQARAGCPFEIVLNGLQLVGRCEGRLFGQFLVEDS